MLTRLKLITFFAGFSGNFDASEVSSFTWTPRSTWLQLWFFIIQQLSSPWCLPAERAFPLLVEGTGSTILAVGGWKATYLFSLWHLSWLASQSIYYISIIQATGVQLTSNNMEFNEVLGFLFIFQKILYLEKQRNRDLFQCRLHLKKKSWWMLFWSLLLSHSEITCFTLKWDDGVWTKWRPLWVSVQLTLYPYVPAWAVGASRIVLMPGEGADYLHISLYFFFFH